MRKLLSSLILLCSCCLFASAGIPFKILKGEATKTTKEKHEVVFQTSPTAKAYINDEQVQVYKTGTFGKALNLTEGLNNISIVIKDKGETMKRNFSITYTPTDKAVKTISEPSITPCDFVATTKKGAYMQYGTGSDRLGASKMNYLEEGICLNVSGKTSTGLYRVQLSSNRFAFIPADLMTQGGGSTESVNSGTIFISDRGGRDEVSVQLPRKVAWFSWMELDPTILYVDLFGVMNNSNWVLEKEGLKMIDYVDVRQVDSDILRLAIKLKTSHSWGYEILWKDGQMLIRLKHSPTAKIYGMRIGIDVGHGGSNRGPLTLTGVAEKDINLQISKRVRRMLEDKGATVIMSRTSDETLSMAQRKERMLKGNVDLMVSIHSNNGGSYVRSMGTSTYYKYIQNRELAQCLLNRLVEIPGLANYGIIGNFNFALGMPTEFPTVLVETAFMSSMPDEEKIILPEGQETIAGKIVAGIEDYIEKVNQNG